MAFSRFLQAILEKMNFFKRFISNRISILQAYFLGFYPYRNLQELPKDLTQDLSLRATSKTSSLSSSNSFQLLE